MVTVDLQKAMAEASATLATDEFWAVRGQAINAYANLEGALCDVFANESSTTNHVAAIIFSKINSAASRNAILEKLQHLRHGTKYNLFWNSIFKALRPIDISRNEIVHWTVVSSMSFGRSGISKPEIALYPRTYLDDSASAKTSPKVSTGDVIKFMRKCNFYAKAITGFAGIVTAADKAHRSAAPIELISAWHDIFQQPLTYPLPKGVQLPQTPQELRTPPRSFQT